MNSTLPFTLRLIETQADKDACRALIEKHHSYVPTYKTVGRKLDWLVVRDDAILGMIGLGSSTYPCPKDVLRFFDLVPETYRQQFNTFSNNWRFCLAVREPNLGTRVLSTMRRAAGAAWKERYGDTLQALITFVGGGHDGAMYKADNWTLVGKTAGLPSNRKAVSMKWNDKTEIKARFVKPTGENRKLIFVKRI